MKFASLLTASIMASIQAVEGCVRVHTQMNYNILMGDIMQVEIWDNNNFYCQTGGKKTLTNNQARWFFTCTAYGQTWEVEMWNDGKAGHVRRRNDGWNQPLTLKHSKKEQDCILYGGKDDTCKLKGQMIESCSTAADDCGGWTCKMCDFRGICGR